MGIKDVLKKVSKRVEKSVGAEEPEEELNEENPFGDEKLPEEEEPFSGKGPAGKGEDFPPFEEEEETPKTKKGKPPLDEEEFAEEEETPKSSTSGTGDIKAQLDMLKSKLDVVEIHLQNIESKEDMHKFEADRYVQYLTFLNEKLDHLERELSEIERLIKRK